jgi:hypothetical protein
MTRAPWTAWTDDEVSKLRALAGRKRAEDIAADLGRTIEQVRGKAARERIKLKGGPWVRNWTIIRQSRGVAAAWKDPAKRSRMMEGRRA